jgi:hypothetical protein
MDLFEENVKFFRALLPVTSDEDPEKVLAEGGVPHLPELRLHNGTVYRWNRPVYDVARGKPHLRVENRVLPAGPTTVDVLANAAFFYGAVTALAEAADPVWRRLEFQDAGRNLHTAARYGLGAELQWPTGGLDAVGAVGVRKLVLDELLPLAHAGLDRLGIDAHDRDEYLGVVEARCRTGRNGATWQAGMFHHLTDVLGVERGEALEQLTIRYADLMKKGDPAHTWEVG